MEIKMNQINMDGIRAFFETAAVVIGSLAGRAVVVMQANPIAVVAAIIVVAALIIGVVCYKNYKANQEARKPVEVKIEFEDDVKEEVKKEVKKEVKVEKPFVNDTGFKVKRDTQKQGSSKVKKVQKEFIPVETSKDARLYEKFQKSA